MNKPAIVICLSLFAISIGLSITFGVLMAHPNATMAIGKLTSVDTCDETCYTNGADGGCMNNTWVSFNWQYQNITYNSTRFHCGIHTCTDCCYQYVNHTIQVEIDPKAPTIPVRFWTEKESPYSIPFHILFIVFLVLTILFAGVFVVIGVKICDKSSYEQIY